MIKVNKLNLCQIIIQSVLCTYTHNDNPKDKMGITEYSHLNHSISN